MADAWGILMMLFFLSHECFAQLTLDPDGVVRVCTGQNQQFMCTSVGVSWTISGFGNGISDASLVPAVDYAANNIRVTTTDNSTISNPSTLTFMMLEYPDDNAIVTCTDAARTRMITSTIRIGPPNCTVDFSVNASGVTIIVNLTVYDCVGYLPMYEVVLSTTGNEPSTMSIETPPFMASTILRIADQKPLSEYNVSLELVDPCQNSTVVTRHVDTDMAPTGTDPNTSSNPSLPANPTGPPPPPLWIIAVIVVLIIIIVAATLIIILIIFVYWKKKQGKGPIAERMTVASDANSEEMEDKKKQKKKEELTYVTVEHDNAPPAEPSRPKKAEAVEYTGVKFEHS